MALSPKEIVDPEMKRVLAKGWHEEASSPCPGLSSGTYYEVDGEESSGEFYASGDDHSFTPLASWPAEPRTCRPITQPNFIQEVP